MTKKLLYITTVIITSLILILWLTIFSNTQKVVEIYLPSLISDTHKQFDNRNFPREPYILNVFNSWCESCKREHSILMSIKNKVNIYGINYFDSMIQAKRFLEEHGNPYIDIGFDDRGVTSEILSVSGLPQTFIIDKTGHIRSKIIGPITNSALETEVLPLYETLLRE